MLPIHKSFTRAAPFTSSLYDAAVFPYPMPTLPVVSATTTSRKVFHELLLASDCMTNILPDERDTPIAVVPPASVP